MSGDYRQSAWACPRCGSPLREHDARLVCDHCQGMLIGGEDFAAAVHELDGGDEPLEASELGPSETPCPRCQRVMVRSNLGIGRIKLPGDYLRCPRDGVWMPQEIMTAVFARASRSDTRGQGRAYRGGGGGGNVAAMSPMGAAMRSVDAAFSRRSPATAGLAISRWGTAPSRVFSVFVSTHKNRRLACPTCKESALDYCGDRWACQACSGSFVENAALVAMVEDMTSRPWQPPEASGAVGERACPICDSAMLVDQVDSVTIDRCVEHGTWFDDSELQQLLLDAVRPPGSIGAWLRALFGRDRT